MSLSLSLYIVTSVTQGDDSVVQSVAICKSTIWHSCICHSGPVMTASCVNPLVDEHGLHWAQRGVVLLVLATALRKGLRDWALEQTQRSSRSKAKRGHSRFRIYHDYLSSWLAIIVKWSNWDVLNSRRGDFDRWLRQTSWSQGLVEMLSDTLTRTAQIFFNFLWKLAQTGIPCTSVLVKSLFNLMNNASL